MYIWLNLASVVLVGSDMRAVTKRRAGGDMVARIGVVIGQLIMRVERVRLIQMCAVKRVFTCSDGRGLRTATRVRRCLATASAVLRAEFTTTILFFY